MDERDGLFAALSLSYDRSVRVGLVQKGLQTLTSQRFVVDKQAAHEFVRVFVSK
ncbi:MAG: hypothetical protein ABEL97_10435 [Salinibacter sp.]